MRHIVTGKNVNKDPAFHGEHLLVLPAEISTFAKNPGIPPAVSGIGMIGLQEIFVLVQFRFTDAAELVIVISEHPRVNVVVPGNKAFMPYRPQQGSAVQFVMDLVFFADTVHTLRLPRYTPVPPPGRFSSDLTLSA